MFAHPAERGHFPADDHDRLAGQHVADLRATAARRAGDAFERRAPRKSMGRGYTVTP